jgi:predicted anti-sigma-YlaC factor YlaD
VTARCEEIRIALGAYVLGALDPAEHAEVDSHLAGCPDCREGLAGLAGLPGQLARVSPDEVDSLTEPRGAVAGGADEAVGRLARRRRRSRRRWLAGGAAVVVLAAGGAVAGTAVATSHTSAPTRSAQQAAGQTITGTSPATDVTARVTLHPSAAGTTLDIRLHGVTPGRTCRLVAIDTGGHREIASTWKAAYDTPVSVPGAIAIATDHLASLRIVAADGTRLVTLPGPA